MSKIKHPREKKRLSLENDCRSSYGNSNKAARTTVPRNKRTRLRRERHGVAQTLATIENEIDADVIEAIERKADTLSRKKLLDGFEKGSDMPLKEFIPRQTKKRIAHIGDKARRRRAGSGL